MRVANVLRDCRILTAITCLTPCTHLQVGKNIRSIFVPGHPLRTTNFVESWNALSILYLAKSAAPSALTYTLSMYMCDMHASERYLYNLDSSAKTWRELVWEKVAAKAGLHVNALVSARALCALRVQVRLATERSNKRRTEGYRIKINTWNKIAMRKKAERAEQKQLGDGTNEHYGKGDGHADFVAANAGGVGAGSGAGSGGGGGGGGSKRTEGICDCGAEVEHKRSSHGKCLRNKKHLAAAAAATDTDGTCGFCNLPCGECPVFARTLLDADTATPDPATVSVGEDGVMEDPDAVDDAGDGIDGVLAAEAEEAVMQLILAGRGFDDELGLSEEEARAEMEEEKEQEELKE